ncbi:MAG: hypothetical protein M9894_18570 [Planctomycetes bacterium]|nr:hypothetical protein [Planctomycetota bacterium]
MTRAQTEPTDGFLDRDFASFREARLKARKTRRHEALEHKPRRAAAPEATTATPSDLATLIDGLETTAPASVDVAPASVDAALASVNAAPAAPVADAAPPPTPDVDHHCSDPEFERFRASRRAAEPPRRPDSARLRRPDGGDVEGNCSDPEFEKFRAARQEGRPDSARHRKPELEATRRAPEPAPAPPPEPVAEAAPPETEPEPSADEGALFFGTSVHERAAVRARALGARSDLGEATDAAEAAPAEAPTAADPEPTPSKGERRRPPPPPLPERP